MVASDRDRISQVTRTVMHWLAKSGDNESSVRTTADDGTRPILVALEDEHFSAVLHRLSWTGGLYATLFVEMNDGSIIAGALMPPESALDDRDKHEFDSEFHRDVRVGEIVRASWQLNDGVNIRVHIGETATDVSPMRQLEQA